MLANLLQRALPACGLVLALFWGPAQAGAWEYSPRLGRVMELAELRAKVVGDGECVALAKELRPDYRPRGYLEACRMIESARDQGLQVTPRLPRYGSLMVLACGPGGMEYGHVAVVEQVELRPDGAYDLGIVEQNWPPGYAPRRVQVVYQPLPGQSAGQVKYGSKWYPVRGFIQEAAQTYRDKRARAGRLVGDWLAAGSGGETALPRERSWYVDRLLQGWEPGRVRQAMGPAAQPGRVAQPAVSSRQQCFRGHRSGRENYRRLVRACRALGWRPSRLASAGVAALIKGKVALYQKEPVQTCVREVDRRLIFRVQVQCDYAGKAQWHPLPGKRLAGR